MFQLVKSLFGCPHKHCTFPRTAKPAHGASENAARSGTYVVCLDCGEEFGYDWQQMKLVSSAKRVRAGTADSPPTMKRAS